MGMARAIPIGWHVPCTLNPIHHLNTIRCTWRKVNQTSLLDDTTRLAARKSFSEHIISLSWEKEQRVSLVYRQSVGSCNWGSLCNEVFLGNLQAVSKNFLSESFHATPKVLLYYSEVWTEVINCSGSFYGNHEALRLWLTGKICCRRYSNFPAYIEAFTQRLEAFLEPQPLKQNHPA